jgi:sec-independent protein translocase protein TatB
VFFDIGPLELVALVVLAVLVFGPDKLPKVIQDVMGFIRKVREFSDSAKEDIRRELGPEFKDFEFEDLNPKTFIRKNLMSDEDEYGLKELKDLGSSFDLRKEMAEVTDLHKDVAKDMADVTDLRKEMRQELVEVTDAVNGVEPAVKEPAVKAAAAGASSAAADTAGATPDKLRKTERPEADEPPPFDSDAT